MYALLIKRSAERDLRRLPHALFERVNELNTLLTLIQPSWHRPPIRPSS